MSECTEALDLWSASWEGDLDTVKALLEKEPAELDSLGLVRNRFGLFNINDYFQSADPLVNASGKSFPEGSGKATPLHWAVAADHRDIVDFLLSLGADTLCSCEFGATAVRIAEQNDLQPLVKRIGESKNVIVISQAKAKSHVSVLEQAKALLETENSIILIGVGDCISTAVSAATQLTAHGFCTLTATQTETTFVRAYGEWERPYSKPAIRVSLTRAADFQEKLEADRRNAPEGGIATEDE